MSDYELVQENNRHVLEATKAGGVISAATGPSSSPIDPAPSMSS